MKLLRLIPLIVALVLSAFAVHGQPTANAANKGSGGPTATPVPPPADFMTTSQLQTNGLKDMSLGPQDHTNGQAHARFGIFGIDSVPSFNNHYFAAGYDSNGNPNNEWYTNTLGNPPELGGTTNIDAPIVPVIVKLLNYDGSPRYYNGQPLISDPTANTNDVVNSPVFSNSTYSSSSTPTQFSDAVQRAEYFKSEKPDWHTLLAPSVKAARTISLLRGTYRFGFAPDGSLVVFADVNTFVADMFPSSTPDNSTVMGSAEVSGDITTKSVSTFLFKNTALYVGDPSQCCIGGFHTYDVEAGDASNGNRERDYIMDFASWTSPGIFRHGAADVSGLSHEISEIYNDPFIVSNGVNNLTPWWLAPNGICDNSLETGDVTELRDGMTYPITMPNGQTYHPQNEALMQWFQSGSSSNAIDGAYSYPDESILTHANVSQKAGCAL